MTLTTPTRIQPKQFTQRRTSEEWTAILNEFIASGDNLAIFARNHDIPYPTIYAQVRHAVAVGRIVIDQ